MIDNRRETALAIRDTAADLAAQSRDSDVRLLASAVTTLAGIVYTLVPVKP